LEAQGDFYLLNLGPSQKTVCIGALHYGTLHCALLSLAKSSNCILLVYMTKNNFGAKFLNLVFLLLTSLVQKSNKRLLLSFLGAFTKLRKATISFVMCVRPSVRMELLGSHRTDFNVTEYFSTLRKPIERIQVSLKSGENNGYFSRRPIYIFYLISLNSC
jgi:hypothetical protein